MEIWRISKGKNLIGNFETHYYQGILKDVLNWFFVEFPQFKKKSFKDGTLEIAKIKPLIIDKNTLPKLRDITQRFERLNTELKVIKADSVIIKDFDDVEKEQKVKDM